MEILAHALHHDALLPRLILGSFSPAGWVSEPWASGINAMLRPASSPGSSLLTLLSTGIRCSCLCTPCIAIPHLHPLFAFPSTIAITLLSVILITLTHPPMLRSAR